MRKSIYVLSILITLSLLGLSGCGAKDTPSTSGETASPSVPMISPSGTQETNPTVSEPSPGDTPSSEPSEAKNAEPTAEAPSESAPAKPSPSPKADDGKDYASLGYQLMENDGLGELQYRMSESALIAVIGEPESKSEPEVWGADGLEHSNWSYTSMGLDIGMAKLPDDPESHIFSLSAMAPCDLSTSRGISIGSTKAAVLDAYKGAIDPDTNDDADSWITIGSAYGGIGVGIEDGVVTYIIIGASAD